MNMILNIKRLCTEGKIMWTKHGLERLQERHITRADIICCLTNCEIIEEYVDDKPNPSYLVLGFTVSSRPIHVVVGVAQDFLWLITTYYPTCEKWSEDFRVRRNQK